MSLVKLEDLLSKEEMERKWRDQELASTDFILPLTDYPKHDDYIIYREALRQWPTLNEKGEYINDFPDTRPELGE